MEKKDTAPVLADEARGRAAEDLSLWTICEDIFDGTVRVPSDDYHYKNVQSSKRFLVLRACRRALNMLTRVLVEMKIIPVDRAPPVFPVAYDPKSLDSRLPSAMTAADRPILEAYAQLIKSLPDIDVRKYMRKMDDGEDVNITEPREHFDVRLERLAKRDQMPLGDAHYYAIFFFIYARAFKKRHGDAEDLYPFPYEIANSQDSKRRNARLEAFLLGMPIPAVTVPKKKRERTDAPAEEERPQKRARTEATGFDSTIRGYTVQQQPISAIIVSDDDDEAPPLPAPDVDPMIGITTTDVPDLVYVSAAGTELARTASLPSFSSFMPDDDILADNFGFFLPTVDMPLPAAPAFEVPIDVAVQSLALAPVDIGSPVRIPEVASPGSDKGDGDSFYTTLSCGHCGHPATVMTPMPPFAFACGQCYA